MKGKITMDVIYVPKGAALEYAPLALNLYQGCRFACKYCFVPDIARQSLAVWSANPKPKKNVLQRIEADAKKMAGDPRTVLLCFTCDPYQDPEAAALTRKTLLILEKYKMTATVLTKAGTAAVRDFNILAWNGWEFGTTLSCVKAATQRQWEPIAPGPKDRFAAIKAAHDIGIKTWVSMEPVYDPAEALKLIEVCNPYVDHWKIGKMNHRPLNINWREFHDNAVALLDSLGAKYYIKKELAAEAGK